jgi:phthalate 4,5-cis-dihydrodiol dehydrogenase
MAGRVLSFGVVGLSRAFVLMRPTFVLDPRCRLVAAADPRPEARAAFTAEFGGAAYPEAEALCADPAVEVVYVASPHQFHADHAVLAARHGKHVLVEKPMAATLADCRRMRDACDAAGVQLVVGPSHGFDAPVELAAGLIEAGEFGSLQMVTALNYTDFLYRPRRPEELDTAAGGGVVFSQAVHQVDVLRRLTGSRVRSVRAQTGRWDPARPTEGAYQAFLAFDSGATAIVGYSGYGRYDTDALLGWIGETGAAKDPSAYGAARARLGERPEDQLKAERAYGSGLPPPRRRTSTSASCSPAAATPICGPPPAAWRCSPRTNAAPSSFPRRRSPARA